MQYFLAIAQPETGEAPDYSSPEFAASAQAWGDFTREIVQSGVLVSGASLQPSATATTVTFVNDTAGVVDGPYAETKEVFAGFYLIEVPDLDAALAWATRLPVGNGSVEVRPVAMAPDAQGTPQNVA